MLQLSGCNQSSPSKGNGAASIFWSELSPFSLGNQVEVSRAGVSTTISSHSHGSTHGDVDRKWRIGTVWT